MLSVLLITAEAQLNHIVKNCSANASTFKFFDVNNEVQKVNEIAT